MACEQPSQRAHKWNTQAPEPHLKKLYFKRKTAVVQVSFFCDNVAPRFRSRVEKEEEEGGGGGGVTKKSVPVEEKNIPFRKVKLTSHARFNTAHSHTAHTAGKAGNICFSSG